jgi:DNA primase
MKNPTGAIIGVRLRTPDGFKYSVTGSREGLFLPNSSDNNLVGPLFIVEGATDTAALLDLGFHNVAGRPSCTGGIKLLVALATSYRTKEVIVVADGDPPGILGARNLATKLLIYVPTVRVVTPPAGIKDMRDWKLRGATTEAVQAAVEAATVRPLTIQTRRVR